MTDVKNEKTARHVFERESKKSRENPESRARIQKVARESKKSRENPKSRARIQKVARESKKSRENPKSRARIQKVARESRKSSENPETKPHNLSGLGLLLIYLIVNIIS